MTIRVFILDDHELVRTGLRTLLEAEEDMEVVGEAGTAEQALSDIGAAQPHVAILDVRLPDISGIEVCREIRSSHPDTSCLMLTSYTDDEARFAAVMAGASGYIMKEVLGTDLVGDIRRVHGGASLLDPILTQEILDQMHKVEKNDGRQDNLKPQERRVLELITQGLTNRQIAEAMFLSQKTVKNYVSSLLSKLGMQRRTEAAVYAARREHRTSPRPEGTM